MLAALNGQSEAVRILIEAGANIGAKDDVSKRFFIRTCVYVCVCVCVLFIHCAV